MHVDRAAHDTIDFYGLAIDALQNDQLLIANVESRTDSTELRLARTVFQRDDRVLVLGSGYGGSSAALALLLGNDAVVSYEANPHLVSLSRSQVRVRGEPLAVFHGAVSHCEGDAPFHISDNWPTSSLRSDWAAGEARTASVPLRDIRQLQTIHQPTAYLIDVEGEEHAIFARMDWTGVRAIVAEIHGKLPEEEHIVNRSVATILAAGLHIAEVQELPHGKVVAAYRPGSKKGG